MVVDLRIEKEEWTGPINADGSALTDDQERGGYWQSNSYERLSVNETLNLGAMEFTGVMKVLGHLHDSVSELKKAEDNGNS